MLVGLMTLMVLNVLWQVFTRYVLRSPSSWTEELARFLLIWVGLLGATYALRRGMHLAIVLLEERLGERLGKVVTRLAASAVALFAVAVLLVGGANLVRLTLLLEQSSAALRVPLGWIYLALPLAGALMLFLTTAELAGHREAGEPGRDASEG